MDEVIVTTFSAESTGDGRTLLRFNRAEVDSTMLDVHETAALLRVTEASVYGWCKRKKRPLPHHRVGSHYRFRRSDVLNWAASSGRGCINSHTS